MKHSKTNPNPSRKLINHLNISIMLTNVPTIISILFVLLAIAVLFLFNSIVRNASLESTRKKATPILLASVLWLIIQAVLAFEGVYSKNLDSIPPKLFIFGFLPALLTIVLLFVTKAGKKFIDSLPLKQLAMLNIIRLPVEIGLFALYVYHTVPKLMTFEGGNLDILSGISAPIVVYLVFNQKTMTKKALLIWHLICLALLINIVSRALLSAPFPFQKLAFDEPNIAIIYFPFIWLPTFIVTTVLFGHLASLRKLVVSKTAQ